MNNLKNILIFSFLFTYLNSQDDLKFNSNHWLFPNFEITYSRSRNSSSLEGKLDDLIDFEYNEISGKDGKSNIYERFNDNYTNYNIQKKDSLVNIKFDNNETKEGFLGHNSSLISVNSLINKFLDFQGSEGVYDILAGEDIYSIHINKIEDNDSLVVYQVPLGYPPLSIKEARVKLKKNSSKLDPLEIYIEFPWYFSFLNYKLEKQD